ncbi:MAG: arginine--tRNA ligase [Candidatus Vogelbacteria bacterium RIFOXYD1_FULL_46_19]|uniref:Arginine--tRNA ligase n=1 Tax=Candidatus Vogelbacteria bacterium RIFOXYD1_FULL_46_19 TaxID=1802439 RepID=A0A1G2QJ19_9BACT|nr:MAG: arginine--tRNA ligase [Candidatus Vogelbacteria bacterium RIFOXYD1_FULL_46_19]
MIRSLIEKALVEELKQLGVRGPKVLLEHPSDSGLGDYATNVAMMYAKKLGEDPIELAGKLVQQLKNHNFEGVEKITVAGFGFINFYLKPDFFASEIKKILDEPNFGRNNRLRRQKTIVEYTDPNPFKVFHIGHLMSNTVGESISRLIEWSGADVKRASYQGDVGLHVAKAIYGIREQSWLFWKEKMLGSVTSRVNFLGAAYAAGAKAYEDNSTAKEEIIRLNTLIYSRTDAGVNRYYDAGRAWSLSYFETIYRRLGTKFDFYFFESEMAETGKAIVNDFLKKQVFVESDGAIVFKGEAHGLHTRVFVNSQGLPTYEAKDLGLAKAKYDKYPYEKSIVITANEQSDYFKVVLKAMEAVFPELAPKIKHISHGLLMLPSGKMSSRTGDVVAAEGLMADIEGKVFERLADRTLSRNSKKEIAGQVAVAAIKFSILKQAPGRDVIFDIEKSVSFEGDSGPYLQYTAVRAASVLAKAKKDGLTPSATRPEDIEVLPLEKFLYQFPEVVERAGTEYAPQSIVTYLLEVASAFNSFYGAHQIIDEARPELSAYRLALAEATRQVLAGGLEILGIAVPSEM